MRAGEVTRPDRITPSVPLQATFLLLLLTHLTLSFSASFLCLVLPMRSPSSVSLMGWVNVGARAAHINSIRSLFTFLLPSLASPLPPHVTFSTRSTLLFALSLRESRTPAQSWLRNSPWCQRGCCLAPVLCSSGSRCFTPSVCTPTWRMLLYSRAVMKACEPDFYSLVITFQMALIFKNFYFGRTSWLNVY